MVPLKLLLIVLEDMLCFFRQDNICPLNDMTARCWQLDQASYGLVYILVQLVSSFLANSHGIPKRSSFELLGFIINRTSLLVYNWSRLFSRPIKWLMIRTRSALLDFIGLYLHCSSQPVEDDNYRGYGWPSILRAGGELSSFHLKSILPYFLQFTPFP